MRDISFFSEDIYLHLPSVKNPKVILAISNAKISRNAYNIYNPFSFKAKLLKRVSQFLVINFKGLMFCLIKPKLHQKSEFISYLEQKLSANFSVSIYHATAKDKVVLQLQSNNKIFGYLKFPLNEVGKTNIKVEKKAIELLSENNIILPLILADEYNEIPYIILPEIKGKIGNHTDDEIINLTSQFKKQNKFKLINHPRVKAIYHDIEALKLYSYKQKIDAIVQKSVTYYYEAFEHGDFAPWNIIKTEKSLVPFDFEFFIEKGIEYFDLIKYHFQVGRILKKKNYRGLTIYIYSKIKAPEIKKIIILFLIKEIIRLKKAKESYQFQDNMLNYICEKTT